MTRIIAVLLLTGAAWITAPSAAFAHAELIASNPADGATLRTPPSEIRLTFSEALQAPFTTVTVTGPNGTQWGLGSPAVVNTVVTIPVQAQGPAGPYTINYRVLSADGHPVSGTVRFTLTGAAPGSSAAAQPAVTTTAPNSAGVPAWGWIAGVVVLLGASIVAALRVGRSARF